MEEKIKESKIEEEKKEKVENTNEKSQALNEKEIEKKKSQEKVAEKKEKKSEAIAWGRNLPISKKHSMYICTFIKGKSVDRAINELQEVIIFKRVIPFKGEIPHRKGMMSGRYPINASKSFINILKALRGNIAVNGLDNEKTKIYFASASWASRPQRRGGTRFKRTHVLLKAKEETKQEENK